MIEGSKIEFFWEGKILLGLVKAEPTGYVVHWADRMYSSTPWETVERIGGYKILSPAPIKKTRNLPAWF